MAIWQCPFQAVPKRNVLDEAGKLLTSTKIQQDGNWISIVDASQYWEKSKLDPKLISKVLDKLITNERWSDSKSHFSWKGNTNNEEDNDCYLSYTNDTITSFSFRVDMRHTKNLNGFLLPILEVCQEHHLVLINEEQRILLPEIDVLKPFLINSKAVRFLQDPQSFIQEVRENHQQTEKAPLESKENENAPSWFKRLLNKFN